MIRPSHSVLSTCNESAALEVSALRTGGACHRGVCLLLSASLLVLAGVGCSDDDGTSIVPTAGTGGTTAEAGSGGSMAGSGGTTAGTGGGMTGTTLCEKYGGPDAIAGVVQGPLMGIFVEDCRVNAFFTGLSAEQMTHVSDCLAIQFQEIFECSGVVFAGSQDGAGASCDDLYDAQGQGISDGDIGAFIDDVVGALFSLPIEEPDIEPVLGSLFAIAAQVVESADPGLSRDACVVVDAGADAGDTAGEGDAAAPDADAGASTPDASVGTGDADAGVSLDAGSFVDAG